MNATLTDLCNLSFTVTVDGEGRINCVELLAAIDNMQQLADDACILFDLKTEEFLSVAGGTDTVTLSTVPVEIKAVYRNGLRQASPLWSEAGADITFVNPFGMTAGGAGIEDVIVDYI